MKLFTTLLSGKIADQIQIQDSHINQIKNIFRELLLANVNFEFKYTVCCLLLFRWNKVTIYVNSCGDKALI